MFYFNYLMIKECRIWKLIYLPELNIHIRLCGILFLENHTFTCLRKCLKREEFEIFFFCFISLS